MAGRRTTIELDEELVKAAQGVTGKTLRATVEQGLLLVIESSSVESERRRHSVREHFAKAAKEVDFDVLMREDAWR